MSCQRHPTLKVWVRVFVLWNNLVSRTRNRNVWLVILFKTKSWANFKNLLLRLKLTTCADCSAIQFSHFTHYASAVYVAQTH
jgi:hypothetical protein